MGARQTCGKGSAQVVMPLEPEGVKGILKVTSERFYLPSGRSTQWEGVKSDIWIPGPIESGLHSCEKSRTFALRQSARQSPYSRTQVMDKGTVARLKARSRIRRGIKGADVSKWSPEDQLKEAQRVLMDWVELVAGEELRTLRTTSNQSD